MSTLGKILTVLIALLAVVVTTLAIRHYVTGEDWRNEYLGMKENFQAAVSQLEQQIEKTQQAKASMEQNRAELQAQIETLQNELALKNNTITQLREEIENQQKRLQDLATSTEGINTSFSELMEQREAWRQERDQAMARADDLNQMLLELEARFRNRVAQLQDATENVRQLREEKEALESRLAFVLKETGFNLPLEVHAEPVTKLEGVVTEVDLAARMAQINLGSDDGVVENMKFYVYDPGAGKYLATLRINKVSHDSAAGELSVIRGTVTEESHVTNRFE